MLGRVRINELGIGPETFVQLRDIAVIDILVPDGLNILETLL
jgi:hypothetical protein